jgi:putative hemolysin
MAFELLVIAVLVLMNGLFAGAEIAVLSVKPAELHAGANRRDGRYLAVEALRRQPERFLATVQIAITVVGAAAGAFSGATLAADLAPVIEELGVDTYSVEVSFAAVIALVSWASLVFGELVPKSLGLRFARPYAAGVARPLLGLSRAMAPLVWFLTACSNAVLRLFGDRTTFLESRVSRDELRELVEDAARSGSVHPEASDIAQRALGFEDVAVEELMVVRGNVVGLDRGAPLADIRRIVLEEGHSRMPVYQGTLDRIVGYVIARDILALALETDLLILEDIIRPAYLVRPGDRAVQVLREMQRRRVQMAIVVDDGGSVAGLVTIEDVIEELVGDIFSEDDDGAPIAAWQEDGTAVVPGSAQVRRLNRALDIELPAGPSRTTIGGVCVSLAHGVPEAGHTLTAPDGTALEILETAGRRVRLVRVRRRPADPAAPDSPSGAG